MPETSQRTLVFEDPEALRLLCGERDDNLRLVESRLGLSVLARGNEVRISGAGPAAEIAEHTLRALYDAARRGREIGPIETARMIEVQSSPSQRPEGPVPRRPQRTDPSPWTGGLSRLVEPKSPAQARYMEAIRSHDVVFGVGPAGTGKTYLAMAMAVSALVNREVKRIVLTRPAVEAGERLGFLPGDLADKVNPYLRPLYDALHDMLDFERAVRLVDRGQIEVAPLAFMRGRTLNDAFVILDEAQNTTAEQMKMFLTRLGFDSKTVVTGDVTQTDLPHSQTNGLAHALHLLDEIDGIATVQFTHRDVVRHPLVQKIILAYEADAGTQKGERS